MLGGFEELIMLAVSKLGDNADAATIHAVIEVATWRDTSLSAIYSTIDRLIKNGNITRYQTPARPQPGGRAVWHYRLTDSAYRALDLAEKSRRGIRTMILAHE